MLTNVWVARIFNYVLGSRQKVFADPYTSQHSEKSWEMIMIPDVDAYCSLKPENTPKNSEKQQLTQNQQILNIKI